MNETAPVTDDPVLDLIVAVSVKACPRVVGFRLAARVVVEDA